MGYTILGCKPQAEAVDSQELLSTMSQIAAKRSGNASCCSSKVSIPLLRGWLWVLLLTVFLSSSGAYSATDTPRSEEGKCRYDLTSIAALSCVQPDGVREPPSSTCCNAILYAIDQVPSKDESGACCLCRYMKEKVGPPGLATAYVVCDGKDKRIISKWSSFPITRCSEECSKTNVSSVGMGNSENEDVHLQGIVKDKGKGTWIAVALFILMGLVCFGYFWRLKAAGNASVQRRTSSSLEHDDSRVGHRRSIAPSSSAKLKERRFSSS